MSQQSDPERNESKALHRLMDFTGRQVLEVGCGEGRMTWLYASECAHVTGIDMDLDALRVARVEDRVREPVLVALAVSVGAVQFLELMLANAIAGRPLQSMDDYAVVLNTLPVLGIRLVVTSFVALPLTWCTLKPDALIIVLLLAIVTASYEQTIHAYPGGGGAYIVARDNLGELPAQTA